MADLERTPVSRRRFLRGAAAASVGTAALALVGCGDDEAPAATATSAATVELSPTASATEPAQRAVRSWTPVVVAGDTPGPRRDHSLTLASDGRVYLFGGRLKGESLDDLWVFDVATTTWSRVDAANAPPARFAHTATWDGARDRLVVATGQGAGGALYNDAWAFDPATKGWTEISGTSAERPEVRYGAGGAYDAAGGRLLVSHGFTDTGRFDDTWSLDLASGAWSKAAISGDLPIKRCLVRTVWLDDSKRMLLFGGQTDTNPFLGDFWSLDLAAGSWTPLTPPKLPSPRNLYGAGFDAATDRWFIVAGNTPDGPNSESWMYDVASGVWSVADDPLSSMMLPARYSTDAVVVGASLYVYGGNDGSADLGDMWMLPLPA